MSRSHVLITLGILVALAPFSGLPPSWLEIILPLLGVIVAFMGYLYRPSKDTHPSSSTETAVA